MIERPYNHRRLLICILLAAVTFAVYLPVRNYEFLHYDDDVYVTNNAEVKSGLSWQGVEWAFTTGRGANWHPLTWLSLMLDCQVFGVKAGPMHIVNVLFHIANTILLFLVLARMTKGVWQSAFIAGLFALHPLHVESVAWIAERKDVLSTLFWLLTMLAYARYAERPSAGRYVAVLVLFAMGLMAKPMLVTLPFVLLLLDYWPLGRFSGRGFSVWRLLLEKIPLLILSAVSSVVTFIVQQRGGAVIAGNRLFFDERVLNAIVSYLAYLDKMLWPAGLAVLYPHPVNNIPVFRAVIAGIVLILITILFIYHARRYKYLLVGWFWYLGTLVPVIGIVQVGSQAMADRYTYVPLIGIFIIIAFGVTELLKEKPFRKIVLCVMAGVSLSACTVVTSHQLKYWKDSLSLFEHTLDIANDNYIMQNNYANILMDKGRSAEAVAHFSEAVKLRPDSLEIRNGYGDALRKMGKLDEAIAQYKIAIEFDPNFILTRYNLGLALAAKGDYEGAIEQYRLYLDTAPDSMEVLSSFGFALAQSGKPKDAIGYYDKVLAKDPNDVITHGRLALVLASVGRIDEAIEQCLIVLAVRPDDFEMYNNLGMLLRNQGKLDEAIESYEKALQINPDFQKAREGLDAALVQKQAGRHRIPQN